MVLTERPSMYVIKKTVFSMDGSSTPGLDGYTRNFFQSFWDVVGSDVSKAVLQFFDTGFTPLGLNPNLMILLPKKEGAIHDDEFRLIIMSNFVFKIITNVLATRLGDISSRIVSQNQYGFVKGGVIHEAFALALEGVNMLNKKCFGGNFAMKVYIRKAFDTLDWDFLITVLSALGFGETFRIWIRNILQSARISLVTAACSRGYFEFSRGVRQGDPLSPILFDMVEDFLSHLLISQIQSGVLDTMRYTMS